MSQRTSDVAVVGLGAIGLPVAVNAAKAGFRTQVWNRSPAAAARAVESGALLAAEVNLIDAPVVLTALPDSPDLDEVLAAGLGASLREGDVLVVLSTVSPAYISTLDQRLSAERGVRVVDAPVSGGDVGAWAATLSIMVGGDAGAVGLCRPVLESIGSRVVHFGPPGSGEVAKLANQIVVGATLAGLGEAINLARAAGLDAELLVEALSAGLAGSRALDVKGEKLISGDFTPGGAASLHLKDLRYAVSQATLLVCDLPLTTELARLYQRLIDQGFGSLDQSAIALLSLPHQAPTEEDA